MRALIVTSFVLCLASALEIIAAPVSPRVPILVQDYYSQDALGPRPLPDEPPESPPHQCSTVPGSQRACIEAACQQMSRFECDERHELLEVTRACRNVSGDCVRNLCGRVGRFYCDDRSEVLQIADACRGLVDVSCVDFVCSQMSRFECDEIYELEEVARQCR